MARLSLKLLGGFQLRAASGAAVPLPSRKARALIAYLALRPGRMYSRDVLTALLWGDTPDRQARQSLRQALLDLRRALRSPIHSRALRSDGEELGLDPAAIDVDVASFERLAAQKGIESLERAAALYQGDLLDGLVVKEAAFTEWLQVERERLRETAPGSARLQQALGHNYRVQGKPELAEAAFRRAADADPALPEIHLALAQLYAEQKRWADARREAEAELALVPESAGARALLQRLPPADAAP